MKCLVTGGAGFIGSHLVERLLFDGHTVSVIDNFSTGRPENLNHLVENKRLRIFEGNINNKRLIRKAMEKSNWVFHLAALADIVPSIQRPIDYTDANIRGTLSVLETARRKNVSRFIYAASSSCYGIPDKYPTPESAPTRPQYPYALSKCLGEQCVMHWHQLYGLPAISLRMFNVFGPRSRTSGTYGAVFGVFLAQKLAGKPFTVVGDGSQTRDFTFVTDVVNAFIMAARSTVSGDIMNVGSGNTHSINYLVELLGGEVQHIPKRPGEPECTFADISRIKNRLDWTAKTSFEEGVKTMLAEIDYWRDAPVWTPDDIATATKEWFDFLSSK